MYKQEYIPNIRFVEFTADWEKHTLKNCTDKIGSGKTPKGGSSIYEKSGIPLLRSQNIHSNKVNFEDVVYITEAIDKEMSNSRVKQKDVLLNITGASIGRSAVYFHDKIANVNQHVCIIRPNSNVDSNFIQLNIASSKGHKQINLNQAGGGREGLNFKQIAKISFYYPKWKEQKKIGSFFNLIDDAIFFQQQLLNDNKQLKKAMLQKMFPQKGETVPKIRFDGFTNDWKQLKLSEIAKYRRGSFPQPYGNKEWYDKVDGSPFVQVADVGTNLKLVEETKQKISKLAQPMSVFVEEGKVLVTLQGSIGRVAITQYPAYVDRTILIFENYKLPVSEYYFANVIEQLFNIEKCKAPGGTIKTITKEVLNEFKVFLPNIKEQIMVAKFFKQLDKSIDIHQKKLETYQELKKAMLQKMFV